MFMARNPVHWTQLSKSAKSNQFGDIVTRLFWLPPTKIDTVAKREAMIELIFSDINIHSMMVMQSRKAFESCSCARCQPNLEKNLMFAPRDGVVPNWEFGYGALGKKRVN
jgi:hypothetical protein